MFVNTKGMYICRKGQICGNQKVHRTDIHLLNRIRSFMLNLKVRKQLVPTIAYPKRTQTLNPKQWLACRQSANHFLHQPSGRFFIGGDVMTREVTRAFLMILQVTLFFRVLGFPSLDSWSSSHMTADPSWTGWKPQPEQANQGWVHSVNPEYLKEFAWWWLPVSTLHPRLRWRDIQFLMDRYLDGREGGQICLNTSKQAS